LGNTKSFMQKSLFLTTSLCFSIFFSVAQKVASQLQFEQGKTLAIHITVQNTVTQQAMGQAIDFSTSGTVLHAFTVTNSTGDNTTLHHTTKSLQFQFDGMGQKRSFDSGVEKDMKGQFGGLAKEMLDKSYDIIIDKSGKTLLARPEKTTLAIADDRMVIITDMLKELTDVIYPPKKGANSFFKILPEQETGIGETWTEDIVTETGKSTTMYTLSAITDTAIVVDFKSTISSATTSQMMGMEATRNMNSTATGKILLDKTTGIIKEKTSTVESSGTTEAMGTNMPLSSKSVITIKVKPQE
jgi:hypothetical protein